MFKRMLSCELYSLKYTSVFSTFFDCSVYLPSKKLKILHCEKDWGGGAPTKAVFKQNMFTLADVYSLAHQKIRYIIMYMDTFSL